MSILQSVLDERARFMSACGFEPARVLMTPEQILEAMESCKPFGGDLLFGMRIEVGERLQCRADRLPE